MILFVQQKITNLEIFQQHQSSGTKTAAASKTCDFGAFKYLFLLFANESTEHGCSVGVFKSKLIDYKLIYKILEIFS